MITASVRMAGGRFELSIDGHADPSVCAAVTALEQTAVLWLEQLSQQLPAELTLQLSQED